MNFNLVQVVHRGKIILDRGSPCPAGPVQVVQVVQVFPPPLVIKAGGGGDGGG